MIHFLEGTTVTPNLNRMSDYNCWVEGRNERSYKIHGPSLEFLRQIFIPASNRNNSSCEVKRNYEVEETGNQLADRLQKRPLLAHASREKYRGIAAPIVGNRNRFRESDVAALDMLLISGHRLQIWYDSRLRNFHQEVNAQ